MHCTPFFIHFIMISENQAKRRKLIVIFLLTILFNGLSVNFLSAYQTDTWLALPETFFIGRTENLPPGVKGSPRAFKEGLMGNVYFTNGGVSETYLVNFDLYVREVIIKKGHKKMDFEFGLNLHEVSSIVFKEGQSDDSLTYVKLSPSVFEDTTDEADFLYRTLTPNSNIFIQNTVCELLEPEKGAYSTGRDYYEFKLSDIFYLKGQNDLYQKFSFTKNKLKKILGATKGDRIIEILDSMNLSIKNPDDLARALNELEN